MRVFREDAALQQPFAHLATGRKLRVDIDSGPQARAPDAENTVADEGHEPRLEASAEHPRTFLIFAGGEHVDDCGSDRGGERVAAEGRTVLAFAEHAHDVGITDHGRHGHDTAAERLAEQIQIRHDARVVALESGSGAPEPGLDLVGDEQHIATRRDRTHSREVVGRRNEDARFALNRLDEHRHRVVVDGRFECVRVAVGNRAESGGEWTEIIGSDRVARETDDRGRATVEVAVHHDDVGLPGGDTLDPVAPGARELDARLDCLGPRIHRNHHVFAGEGGELGDERAELVVMECTAGQGDAVELLMCGLQELRMPMTEVDSRVRGEAIEVPAALDIRHPRAFTVRYDDLERAVGVSEVLIFHLPEVGAYGDCGCRSGRCHRRSSRVQHFTPPPPSSNSERSTPIGL